MLNESIVPELVVDLFDLFDLLVVIFLEQVLKMEDTVRIIQSVPWCCCQPETYNAYRRTRASAASLHYEGKLQPSKLVALFVSPKYEALKEWDSLPHATLDSIRINLHQLSILHTKIFVNLRSLLHFGSDYPKRPLSSKPT